jgi:hypothetical protein
MRCASVRRYALFLGLWIGGFAFSLVAAMPLVLSRWMIVVRYD